MYKTVIVIGGGAGGLIAAGKSAEKGNNVILIEKNKQLGRKLLITGKGRCNITNATDIRNFFEYIPTNPKFLYNAFFKFTNTDLINFLNNLGLETKVERGGRIFPVSDKARDVLNTLVKYCQQNNVNFIHDTVIDVTAEENKITGVILKNGGFMKADSVIIATGGISYKLTGSTGDGYKFAKKLGHTITPLKPSLIPLIVKEKWIKKLQGLSLKNVKIVIYDTKDKKIYEDFGEMLFTHFGLSGPIILKASSNLKRNTKYKIKIDLKPALDEKKLDKRILRDIKAHPKKHYENYLKFLLPKKLIPIIRDFSHIDGEKQLSDLSRDDRQKLIKLIKNFSLTITGFRPDDEAIITSGGINVKEINPKTMESKIIKGLFFVGEVIDVDAYTGGFNLQITFSTGIVAGENA